jgi:hypothetical protein
MNDEELKAKLKIMSGNCLRKCPTEKRCECENRNLINELWELLEFSPMLKPTEDDKRG